MFRASYRRVLRWALALLAIVAAISVFSDNLWKDLLMPIIVGMAAGFIVFGIQRLTLFGRAKKLYRESVPLHEVLTFSVTEDGFSFEQASGNFRGKWENLVKWDENDEILAIFSNRCSAFVFPKTEVGAEMIDHIRSEMIASGLQKKGKLRK
ncbi:MAG: YcxB family protein [Sphingomonadaceae bacterium]|nr:YcxB family protein [Sphingomonadaceae bacterium]